jgi:hypothetical protein
MLFDDMVIENVIIIDEGLLEAIIIVNVMTNRDVCYSNGTFPVPHGGRFIYP